jgi:two-component system cell cycle response regulator DivK
VARPRAPHHPPPLILVVDDNVDAREMYRMYLEFAGYRCLEAASGSDAVRLAREHQPALILMDAMMPGMDGWETTAILATDPELETIPVVMLTGQVLPEHRRKAREAGAVGFLAKPVLPDEVARAVTTLLRRH